MRLAAAGQIFFGQEARRQRSTQRAQDFEPPMEVGDFVGEFADEMAGGEIFRVNPLLPAFRAVSTGQFGRAVGTAGQVHAGAMIAATSGGGFRVGAASL